MLSWQLTSHLCGHICVSDIGDKHALQLELNRPEKGVIRSIYVYPIVADLSQAAAI